MVRRTVIPPSNKPARTGEVLDVAARYLLYKLYDASKAASPAPSWHSVRSLGEEAATIGRAVERGWIVIRDEGNKGKAKERWLL
jgi:hypothetical protein